jgi:hypothetical protein
MKMPPLDFYLPVRKFFFLFTFLLAFDYVVNAQQSIETVETTSELIDPAFEPSKKIAFSATYLKSQVTISLHSYIGKHVTFIIMDRNKNIVAERTIDNCNEFTCVTCKVRKLKQYYTVRIVTPRLKHLTQLFVV